MFFKGIEALFVTTNEYVLCWDCSFYKNIFWTLFVFYTFSPECYCIFIIL